MKYLMTICTLLATLMTGCANSNTDKTLVAHYPFDTLSPDQTQTPDATAHAHHGLIQGQPLVPGAIDMAMRFEAFPEQIMQLQNLRFRAPATVSFWVWTRDIFHERSLLSQLQGPEIQNGALRFDGAQLEIRANGQWNRLIRDGLRITQWMHIAVVYGADGNATGYLNGQPALTVPCSADFIESPIAIGAPFLGNQGNPYSGRLDDFRIYSRVLTPSEIAALATPLN